MNQYLSACGVGSRRKCDMLIKAGRVSVNGEQTANPALRVEAGAAVRLDGHELWPEAKVYFLFNKPRNVICTAGDPEGRRTCQFFFRGVGKRLFSVGRLDRNSEGLLILTNDGDFANMLAHPRFGVKKTYLVWTPAQLDGAQLRMLKDGISDGGEILRASDVAPKGAEAGLQVYELTLAEGRNREIRRMFEAIGAAVKRLKRIAIGPVRLGGLAPGKWRRLTEKELAALTGTDTGKTAGTACRTNAIAANAKNRRRAQ